MLDTRILFKKTDRARYISHLDLYRCFQRAIKRSGIPVWYTEGFNKHMYLTFSTPISLGFESMCETLDLRLINGFEPADVAGILNPMLPEGIKVLDVYTEGAKHTEIASSKYSVSMVATDGIKLNDDITAIMTQDEILTEKKTKKGIKTVNIKESILKFEISDYNETMLSFEITLPAGTQLNVNPNLLINYIKSKTGDNIQTVLVKRVGLYDKIGNNFK